MNRRLLLVALAALVVLALVYVRPVALGRYLAFAAQEGDTRNDWLTHLHPAVRPLALALGQWLCHVA